MTTWRRVVETPIPVRTLLVAATIAVLAAAIISIRETLIVVFLGVFLALVFEVPVRAFMQRTGRGRGLSATIVLVNNDGGGIFSFLPQASAAIPGAGLPERYEELFGTPHGIDVAPIVTALGGEHELVAPADLRARIEASVGRPGVQVLELRTDRARNGPLHRQVPAAVAGTAGPRPYRGTGADRPG